MSHVCPESERLKAVSELVRVARKGAPVFVSVISKYGVLLATPQRWPQAVADPREDFPRLIRTGDSDAFVKDGYCHFFTSAEMERLFTGEKVELLQKVGLEGFNTEAWRKWLEIHETSCTDPFVVDASGHMMIVVRKE